MPAIPSEVAAISEGPASRGLQSSG